MLRIHQNPVGCLNLLGVILFYFIFLFLFWLDLPVEDMYLINVSDQPSLSSLAFACMEQGDRSA